MNKAEFTAELADRCNITKKNAGEVFDQFIDIIQETVTEGEKVAFVGFGSWEARLRKQREGRNPKTNEKMIIPATRVPVFTAGQPFKDVVAERY